MRNSRYILKSYFQRPFHSMVLAQSLVLLMKWPQNRDIVISFTSSTLTKKLRYHKHHAHYFLQYTAFMYSYKIKICAVIDNDLLTLLVIAIDMVIELIVANDFLLILYQRIKIIICSFLGILISLAEFSFHR